MAGTYASTSEPSPDSQNGVAKAIHKSFSCVLCAQRKVKCDRIPGGCANCTKVRVPCVYKAPPPARRRKKGEREVDNTARLRIYEDTLRQLGVDPEALVKQAVTERPFDQRISGDKGFFPHQREGEYNVGTDVGAGLLVSKEGRSRYLENGVWTSLRSEFRDTKEILDDSSDEEDVRVRGSISTQHSVSNRADLLFDSATSYTSLRSLHPDSSQVSKVWQAYLRNINPLVKLFHAPTIEQLISEATENLDEIPRNLEALLFGIYCIVLESLTDEECISTFGGAKSATRQKFRSGAQCALMNASLMKSSDIMVLQAFVLFLLSLQNYDARIIWIWSGAAQRIGQGIGLHRDGAKLGLPPFEVEMRRRLWWQIMMLEGYSQKLAGTGNNSVLLIGDVLVPSNVNDSDLHPAMGEVPKDEQGATEMMFFLIRCHAAEFLRRSSDAKTSYDGAWHKITTSTVPVAAKDEAIDQLEHFFQHKFLQYCDPAIDWHYICIRLAKSVISMMRFMAHSTGYDGTVMPQSEKDMLFNLVLEVTATQNLAYTREKVHGLAWHTNLQFQWKAFVFLVAQLRHRTSGPKVEEAWREVEHTFDFHPIFEEQFAKRALPVAVSNLTLKAWEAHLPARGSVDQEPYFIQLIRQRCPAIKHIQTFPVQPQSQPHPGMTGQGIEGNEPVVESHTGPSVGSFQTDWSFTQAPTNANPLHSLPEAMPLDIPENIDWTAWDSLFVNFQATEMDGLPPPMPSFNFRMQ
ncbi:hypothetical protein HBI56_025600 [Parastagonospora nodorum]|nr:hypothetical protein HBH53_033580 [Parastagonospora nodorum]KAH4025546.1 hypothetical protein HBI09_154870 [Parastagonospora nodorum]KAH4200479.1 hypothetical protein HBI95_170200 [Parastagonospora nodorum]KAH4236187.1 hypothetical protein HBI05_133850 [Parastagonospora nodorum]KAH4241778.1 hypothetical protein HBI06_013770 [Parastagonospora nodorum]